MEFKIAYDPIIDKLTWIYEIFAPPTSKLNNYYIMRFLYMLPSTRHLVQVAESLKSDNLEIWGSVISGKLDQDMQQSLDFVDPPKPDLGKAKWIGNLDNREFCKSVKAWFDLVCPRQITVYISNNLPNQLQGTALPTTAPTISLSIGSSKWNKREITRLLYHEAMHVLLRTNDFKSKYWPGSKFEECLLDFFVPRGYLALKLDLASKKELKKELERIKNQSTSRATWYREWSVRLYPLLSEFKSRNVWDYLAENADPNDKLWKQYLYWYKNFYLATRKS